MNDTLEFESDPSLTNQTLSSIITSANINSIVNGSLLGPGLGVGYVCVHSEAPVSGHP